jgi:c-di-GMP-binding flagellar brake protein YcgR
MSEPIVQQEKRQHPRVACELDSVFKDLDNDGAGYMFETTVRDISEGGFRFRANRFIPVHDKLLVTLHIPNHRAIEAIAQPAWIREIPSLSQFDIGAKFLSLSETDRELIRQLTQTF